MSLGVASLLATNMESLIRYDKIQKRASLLLEPVEKSHSVHCCGRPQRRPRPRLRRFRFARDQGLSVVLIFLRVMNEFYDSELVETF